MEKHLKTASYISHLLDARFKILNIRFGYDTFLGLAPVVGDTISLLFSLYLLWIALKMKLPFGVIFQMLRNSVFDYLIGLVPIIGDLSDIFYRANLKNLDLIKKYAKSDVIDAEVVG